VTVVRSFENAAGDPAAAGSFGGVTILRERKVWRKKDRRPARRRPGSLTEDEANNVLACIFVAHDRHPSRAGLARLMGITDRALAGILAGRLAPDGAAAVGAAKALDEPVDAVVAGAVARMATCILCGQLCPPTVAGQLRWADATDWRGADACAFCLRLLK
jgi:hypothetical protein